MKRIQSHITVWLKRKTLKSSKRRPCRSSDHNLRTIPSLRCEFPNRLLCCCLVAQLCLTLCIPVDCSMPSFPVLAISWSLLKFKSSESVMPFNHLILCHPLLLLPSIFPSIWVFSNKLALCIRWPKYWSFSINPSDLVAAAAQPPSAEF